MEYWGTDKLRGKVDLFKMESEIIAFLLSFVFEAVAATSRETMFTPFEASASSWSNTSVAKIRVPSLEPASMVCPMLAVTKGLSAYTYDASTSTCVLGTGTCVRAAAADADKDVVNVANVVVSYLGCYNDAARDFMTEEVGSNLSDLTPWSCSLACFKRGFTLSGTVLGHTCLCGLLRPGDDSMANESVDCQAECTGDPSQECGSDASDDFLSLHQREALGSPQARPFWPVPQEVKSSWLLTGTASGNDTWTRDRAIDDNDNSMFITAYQPRSWLQIDFGLPQIVKGAFIFSNGDRRQGSFFEVRVGSTDVSADTSRDHDKNKICANHLCYRVAKPNVDSAGIAFDIDCVQPVEGRYLTLQRYGGDLREKELSVSDIGVILYCGEPEASEDVCPMVTGESDECDLAQVTGITYVGCYNVMVNLPNNQGQYSSTNRPVNCAAVCIAADPANVYAGVRGPSHCHCGTSLTADQVGENYCKTPCPGDASVSCGNSGYGPVFLVDPARFAVPAKVVGTSGWTVTASSASASESDPARLIDGDTVTNFMTQDLPYSWVQVDMGSSKTVFGLEVHLETASLCFGNSLEIRVGQTNAGSVTKPGHKICSNRVCHTTGHSQDIPGDVHSFPCTAPLPGRFITVQKTRLSLCPNVSLGWRGGLRLAEVVVVEMPAPA